jgi:hypothetical protein
MPFRGAASATSATIGATSSAANGLEQAGRKPDYFSLRAGISDAAEEFKELRRADDRVRDAGGLDQFLLRELGAEVAILWAIDAHDRQGNVVLDARSGLGREKVAPRSLEELQNCLVFEWRWVGEIGRSHARRP